MIQKKWIIGVASFLAVTLLLSGFVAFASELGSQSDPLVSLGYIEKEFTPSLLEKIDAAVAQQAGSYQTDLDAKYNKLSADLQAQISAITGSAGSSSLANDPDFINAVAAAVLAQMPASSGGGGSGATINPGFTRVDVKNGKTITLELGSEILLRAGSANCVASGSPGLIDLTTGGDLSNGSALVKSHHYICTVAGRGVKATADIIVFIRGGYSES